MENIKQYTKNDFDVIYSQISGCERVAGYLADNLEKIPFADLRERLENLRALIALAKSTYTDKAQDKND